MGYVIAAPGIVGVGISDDLGQTRAFPQGQLAQVLAEIILRGDFHPVTGAAQVNDVQVFFQNLVLGHYVFQLQRQIGLLKLALVGLFAGEQRQLDQLVRNGGSALGAAAGDVVAQCAADSLDVHPLMLVKAGVLTGDNRVFQHVGNFVDAGVNAVFAALVFGDQVAVFIVDKGGLALGLNLLQIQRRRGVDPRLGHPGQQPGAAHADHQHQQHQHFGRGHDHAEQKAPVPFPWLEKRGQFFRGVFFH